MRITAELSLYPLQADFIVKIQSFIQKLRTEPGLEVRSNQMSTQIRGELDAVVGAVRGALEASFADGQPEVLVAKFLNADLPIDAPPDAGSVT